MSVSEVYLLSSVVYALSMLAVRTPHMLASVGACVSCPAMLVPGVPLHVVAGDPVEPLPVV